MDTGIVDCHCHISACEFAEDLEDVIKRTKKAGVQTLISVTEEASEFERVIQLFKSWLDWDNVHYPLFPEQIGLDFTPWYAPTSKEREEQLTVFTKQLEISKELNLPVNIHSRSAAKVTIATLKEQGITRALLHNFAGKLSTALEGVQAGYFFSFPPAVCRNDQRANLIKQIPLEHICLETDSPALGPEKYVRNEPKNILLVCEYIAQLKGITAQMVVNATTENALRLFPKIKTLDSQLPLNVQA